MQAKETKLQDIIEGTKQYVIPLFQRTYSWTHKEWEVLWKDILELYATENPKPHFIGSIVNLPATSVPEGVNKYLLIDGQQRLTTIFVILALLRNMAEASGKIKFSKEIHDTLLVNVFKEGQDYFKLLPTQADRGIYEKIIKNEPLNGESSPLTHAYSYFERKLRQESLDLEKLKKVVANYFSLVSIVLDDNDNPHLVFESLNAKGRPLTQADLIRNYFFMRIHIDQQADIYNAHWFPMQESLKEKLTEYIRHYLMMDGRIVKQSDVYYSLKETVTKDNAIEVLKEINNFSGYYNKLVNPAVEPDLDLRRRLERLNRLEVTTAYPFLLRLYKNYASGRLVKSDFAILLGLLENFLIRRFVCAVPTNTLNKTFPQICKQFAQQYPQDIVDETKKFLQGKGYPKDSEFLSRFTQTRLYGGGDRNSKTKLILDSFEESFGHKEAANLSRLTIEHVMPQTLSDWWKTHLGDTCEETHDLFLDTIGNLTLTAYNSEISNSEFDVKKKFFSESHIDLNRYFSDALAWRREDIETRADALSKVALQIWAYFGEARATAQPLEPTGNSPESLTILGQKFAVSTWRDVLEKTMQTILDLEPEKFKIIMEKFPRYVGHKKDKFRQTRELAKGIYIEMNVSARDVTRLCLQALESVDLTADDWILTYK